MITIDIAKRSDIKVIHSIAEATIPTCYTGLLSTELIDIMEDAYFSQFAIENQMNEGQVFLCAKNKEDIVGFCSFTKEGLNLFRLTKIYIMPEFQHQGLGRKLFNKVLEEIKKTTSTYTLEVYVNHHNKSYGFYTNLGMKYVRVENTEIINGYVLVQDVLAYTK